MIIVSRPTANCDSAHAPVMGQHIRHDDDGVAAARNFTPQSSLGIRKVRHVYFVSLYSYHAVPM